MSWIKEIAYSKATGSLKKLYERVKGPDNNIDNVLSVHSLRPHSLKGHLMLYKNVLHHQDNTLPKWYLEMIGVYVSFLNRCDYCIEHHRQGLKRLLADDRKCGAMLSSMVRDELEKQFDAREYAGLRYANQLTLSASEIVETDIDALRNVGYTDGEILEINQVACYFNYVNRMVLGLGVNTDGDILGLSPNDDSDSENWAHS